MTVEEAKEVVRRYAAHAYIYQIADDGTVVVGGNDHYKAMAKAKANGYIGPVVRVYDSSLGDW